MSNNPPAFPRADGGWSPSHDGMTLRDWFAGQALANHKTLEWKPEHAAKQAYAYADAMLAERERPQ